MATLDIFNSDAFSLREMVGALDKTPYNPQFLGSLNIFDPVYLTGTDIVQIEKRDNILSLVSVTQRYAPAEQRENEKRDIRPFQTHRLKKGDTITAAELLRIRAFGSTSELVAVAAETLRRQMSLRDDIELTWENHRLGAVQGIVLDADGTTTVNNWYTEWDISQPAEIDFALGTSTTNVRTKCQQVIRAMQKAAKGAWTPNTMVHALCGDTFYDDLIDHANVRATYLNWAAAQELTQNKAFQSFPYGGIVFHNYRGTDNFTSQGSSGTAGMGIDATKAKFFPVGARDVFKVVWAPGESFADLEGPAIPLYPKVVPDRARDQFVEIEMYSYPLYMCNRPEMLQRAKRS